MSNALAIWKAQENIFELNVQGRSLLFKVSVPTERSSQLKSVKIPGSTLLSYTKSSIHGC